MTKQKNTNNFLDRIFPDLGLVPAGLTVLSASCLVLYSYRVRGETPTWFTEASERFTGIEAARFHEHGWSHLCALVILMFVPLLISRLIGIKPLELGLSIRGAQREFILVLLMWAALLPIIWFISGTESFARTYPRLPQAETDMALYFMYEGIYLVKWVAWEFFFRGFMLFAFYKEFGNRAVLISTIPFVIMHIGKPEAEAFASILAGFILCWIALRSKSIWPGVILHSLVAASMDFFASTWWR